MLRQSPNRLLRAALIFTLLTLLLGACASSAAPTLTAEREAPAAAAPGEPNAASEIAYDSASGGSSAQAVERLVIKNASLTIVVDDPSQSMDNLARLAEEFGGYVVFAELTKTTTEGGVEVPRASVTLRVPAERLDDALERIQAESSRDPLNKTINSQDVTKEYTDLQSSLRNLEAAEAQLTKIMEDANRTEDVLSVYQELTRVRGEIEVIKGQIQYYEQSAALSAVSVEILANAAVQPLTVGSWEPTGVAKSAVQALIVAMKFLVNAGIWLVLFFLPLAVVVLLPIAFVVWLARRLLRARRKPSAAAPPPAQPA